MKRPTADELLQVTDEEYCSLLYSARCDSFSCHFYDVVDFVINWLYLVFATSKIYNDRSLLNLSLSLSCSQSLIILRFYRTKVCFICLCLM